MASATSDRNRFAAPVLALCGVNGSGRSTLLDTVLSGLTRSGLAVAVVEHVASAADTERRGTPGTGSGPDATTARRRSPCEAAGRFPTEATGRLLDHVGRLATHHDLVLVEGHAATPLPKVWLASPADAAAPDRAAAVLASLPWNSDRPAALRHVIDQEMALHHRNRALLAGVLIGGASSRLGRPKQLLELGGRSFLERVVDAVTGVASEVVLLGAGDVPPGLAGLPRLADPVGPAGPLAGMLAALRGVPLASWVIVACDLPLLDRVTISWLLDQRAPGRWAVLPRGPSGRVEPLVAVYEPQARTLLETLAAEGEPAPRRLARYRNVVTPRPPQELAASLHNVNSARQFEALRGSGRG